MIIGPSAPSSSIKGWNEISGLGETLCVIFCLATLCHGAVIGGGALNFPLSSAKISFGDFVRNDPRDDEPMWAADRVVAPTPGSAITIPETANEFAIKDTDNEVVRLMMFSLSLTGEAKTWLDELNEGTIETWDELRTAFISQFFPPALFD
ncbi:reverse transcriptase domain-containing protein [Tanacetum coccineum]|uniref:Reverse transcriptase domain-containing protein n=1 Tax=Tanacetum coccineum TaxID=301880 RepID=A0ABQ5DQW0_9ASTR